MPAEGLAICDFDSILILFFSDENCDLRIGVNTVGTLVMYQIPIVS